MSNEYLTTEQLAERIQYEPRTILTRLKDEVMKEGDSLHPAFRPPEDSVALGCHRAGYGRFFPRPAPRSIPMAKGRVAGRG